MKNFQIIKEGAKKFWKNPILGLPALLQLVINYIPIILVSAAIALMAGVPIISILFNPGSISMDLLDKIILWIIILFVILGFLLMIIYSFFEGMLIGMLKSGKRKLDFGSGVKFWSRIFRFYLLFGIYIVLTILIVGATAVLTKITVWLVIIPVIISLAFLISIPLFLLGSYYIVINDLKVKEALKKSCKIVWKHYFKFLGLMLLLTIIAALVVLILGWIPFAGVVLINVLSMTYIKICFYLFASSRD